MSGYRVEPRSFEARFRVCFTHASTSRARAASLICIARGVDGVTGYGEGCPHAYVTGKTIATASAFLAARKREIEQAVGDLDNLRDWVAANREAIDANPAAFAAVELALIDLFARRGSQPIETHLGLPGPGALPVSAVFGVTGATAAGLLAAGYRMFGMTDAKVKLSSDAAADRRRIRAIRAVLGSRMRLRVDANNHFGDAEVCTRHLEHLGQDVWAIEEPLRPGDVAGQRRLAQSTGARIILDESGVRSADLRALDGEHWIVNLRISKHGGLLRSLEMVEVAKARGMDVMIGSHVGESSLLARAALTLATACPDRLLATECGYGGFLLSRDVTRPSFRFKRGGLLGVERSRASGLGIDVDESLLAGETGRLGVASKAVPI